MLTSRENKLDCVLVLALLLAVAFTPLAGFGQQCASLQREVFRLHILANTASRTASFTCWSPGLSLFAGTSGLFGEAHDLAEAEALAADSLPRIEALANAELLRQGLAPTAKAQLTNMYFETRVYENATLPAGRYDALRLTLGSGQGKNWWCVVFPPLCVEAATKEKTDLQERVETLDERPNYKLAFASVELVEGLLEKFRDTPAPQTP